MKRPVIDGFFLVWRHQRLVWWIFLVNLVLGFLASIAPRVVLHSLLDGSLYAQQLSKHFDMSTYLELLAKPEASTLAMDTGSGAVALIFLIYIIFISGGVLSVYRDDRKLGRGEFFEACGDFFWRMVRLLLCSVIPFGIVFALVSVVQVTSGKMASDAPWEKQGFWVQVVGLFLCFLFALFVRAWFDLAQARTVADRARGMFWLTVRSFVLALKNFPQLVFMYFSIALIGALLIAGVWFIWLHVPHASFGTSWLLLELLALFLVGLRVWQRAATVIWYENYLEAHAAPVPMPPAPSPLPSDIVQTDPVPVTSGEFA